MKHTLAGFLIMAVFSALGAVGGETAPAVGTWPGWRGPKRSGIVDGEVPWPGRLDDTRLSLMWREELGEAYSGPVVSTGRVFTVETLSREKEIVRAFDRFTGRQIWESSWEGSMKVPFFSAKNGSWVRSTPAYDGGYLYVAGMRDVLVCLKADDGSELWRVDFVKQLGTPLPDFGFVCSPLVVGGAVYVQAGAGFVKLNRKTGQIMWRTLGDDGGMYGSAFSSPVYGELCGVRQLIVQTRHSLAGVDPEDGSVLWKQTVKAFRGMNIQTPIAVGDTIFTSCYGGASLLFSLRKEGGQFAVSEIWRDKRSQGYMSTPVVVGDNIYFHRRDQRFSCLDPKAKAIRWQSPVFGQYCSLASDGARILALNQKGKLLLIDATPESFKLLDSRKISEQATWGHIAVAGDQVFVRELEALSVFRWTESGKFIGDGRQNK